MIQKLMIHFIGTDKTNILEFFEDISAGYFPSNDDSNEPVERCFCLVLLHRYVSCSQRTLPNNVVINARFNTKNALSVMFSR